MKIIFTKSFSKLSFRLFIYIVFGCIPIDFPLFPPVIPACIIIKTIKVRYNMQMLSPQITN